MRAWRWAAAPAAAAISGAACAGADGGSVTITRPATTLAAATTAAPPSSTAGEAVVPIEVPPCDLLTAADVEVATGLAVTAVRAVPPLDCVFDLDAGPGLHVVVGIEDGMGRLAGAANLYREYGSMVDSGESAAVAGVGEGAYCCPFRAIAVDAGGGRFVSVAVGGPYTELAEPSEALIEMARAVVGRL